MTKQNQNQTTKTTTAADLAAHDMQALNNYLAAVHNRLECLQAGIDRIPAQKAPRNGIPADLRQHMEIEAQVLGIRSAEDLTVIVLRAFIDMCDHEQGVTLPLMLQQVPSLD